MVQSEFTWSIDEWNCIIFEPQHGSTFEATNSIELVWIQLFEVIYVAYGIHTGSDMIHIDGYDVQPFTCG